MQGLLFSGSTSVFMIYTVMGINNAKSSLATITFYRAACNANAV